MNSDRQELLDTLRAWHQACLNEGRQIRKSNYLAWRNADDPTLADFNREFGDWQKAFAAAGLDRPLGRPSSPDTPESILDAIRAAHTATGGKRLRRKDYKRYQENHEAPSLDRICRTFGRFSEACRLANVPRRNKPIDLATDRDELRIQIQKNHFGRQAGLSMSQYDAVRDPDHYCSTSLRRAYGSWRTALEDAGVQPL